MALVMRGRNVSAWILVPGALAMLGVAPAQSPTLPWPYSPLLDAVSAAPKSHRVLLENDHVRVLEVVVQPGQKEPIHTHRWPSVLQVTSAAQLRYFRATLAEGKWTETPADGNVPSISMNTRAVQYLEPEGPHAVENVGGTTYRATRVEIKDRT